MRGLDGNYINTQGDASTRIQVAYQGEQNRQQIRAQTESLEELRKLREQVNETEKKKNSTAPGIVKEDEGFNSRAYSQGGRSDSETLASDQEKETVKENESSLRQSHIDIRV